MAFTIAVLVNTAAAQAKPERDYLVYVVSEAADKIALVRFGPGGARVDHDLTTGMMPADIDGPHGITISPDKQFYYVSIAHGRPNGTVWKYAAKDDRLVGRVVLGMFPATMDITPDGNFFYAVNFNLHGDMVPSSVSIVAADQMIEVARVPTCTMPHGSRFNPQGTKHYSACMMDDMLVEIDTRTFRVARHFMLTRGRERGMNGAPHMVKPSTVEKTEVGTPTESAAGRRTNGGHMNHAGHSSNASQTGTPAEPAVTAMPRASHDTGGHGLEPPAPGDTSCSPTWAQPSRDGSSIYVACNKSSEIVEIDVEAWKVKRRLAARPGVYNLATTGDERLITTNKRDQSISVIELKTGRELARLPTKRRVVHGATVSPDNRYAFISVEGVGTEPGTVEIIDLEALKTVATVDVGPQAGGIEFWKMEGAEGKKN